MADNSTGYTDERKNLTTGWNSINSNSVPVNIGGLYMTDNLNIPGKYQMPNYASQWPLSRRKVSWFYGLTVKLPKVSYIYHSTRPQRRTHRVTQLAGQRIGFPWLRYPMHHKWLIYPADAILMGLRHGTRLPSQPRWPATVWSIICQGILTGKFLLLITELSKSI